jgi:hypothetical protein
MLAHDGFLGSIPGDFIRESLSTKCNRFSPNFFRFSPANLHYPQRGTISLTWQYTVVTSGASSLARYVVDHTVS